MCTQNTAMIAQLHDDQFSFSVNQKNNVNFANKLILNFILLTTRKLKPSVKNKFCKILVFEFWEKANTDITSNG